MTFQHFQENFTEKATKSGYSFENIQKCLDYAKFIISNNLPVIFNTSHFSLLVGYRKSYIKKAVLYPSYFYRSFAIKKKNGSLRYLQEPLPSLMEIQNWILTNILYDIQVSRFAKAYIPKRNLFDNVKYHRNKEMVICLDIENFFSSISRAGIENIFLSVGYSSNVSNLLSKLCCLNDCLPQGAPTSPYLSNIYMKQFDTTVSAFCRVKNIRYSRYADDLTFSGQIEPEPIIEFIKGELFKLQLSLNMSKIKIMGRNVRQIVTGIVVNNVVQVPKKSRDKIRQEVYFIKKLGLIAHLKNTKNNRANYLNHLLGKISYVLSINHLDDEMKGYYEYIISLLETR